MRYSARRRYRDSCQRKYTDIITQFEREKKRTDAISGFHGTHREAVQQLQGERP